MKKAKYGLSEAELRNDGVAYVPCLQWAEMSKRLQTTTTTKSFRSIWNSI